MNKLLKRKQLLAGAGFVALGLIIGLAGLMLAVLPQRSKVHDLNTQIDAAQTKLTQLQARAQRGPVVKAADLFQLARAMPDDPDMPGILLDLSRAAARAKVSIVSITPTSPIAQPDGASALPLRLVVDGDWSGISSFLHGLRTQVRASKTKLAVNGRLFVADSIQLATRNDTGELEATIGASAFTYGAAPPVTPATGTTGTSTTSSSGSAQAAGGAGSTG